MLDKNCVAIQIPMDDRVIFMSVKITVELNRSNFKEFLITNRINCFRFNSVSLQENTPSQLGFVLLDTLHESPENENLRI